MRDFYQGHLLERFSRPDSRTLRVQLSFENVSSSIGIIRNDIVNLKDAHGHFCRLFAKLADRLKCIEKRLDSQEP